MSEEIGRADGLTYTLCNHIVWSLGAAHSSRIVGAEKLVSDFSWCRVARHVTRFLLRSRPSPGGGCDPEVAPEHRREMALVAESRSQRDVGDAGVGAQQSLGGPLQAQPAHEFTRTRSQPRAELVRQASGMHADAGRQIAELNAFQAVGVQVLHRLRQPSRFAIMMAERAKETRSPGQHRERESVHHQRREIVLQCTFTGGPGTTSARICAQRMAPAAEALLI